MSHGRRILVIDEPLSPTPVDGGTRRMVELLSALVSIGFEVAVATPGATQPAAHARLGVQVVGQAAEDHLRVAGPAYDAVVLSRPDLATALIGLVRASAPQAIVVYDTVDIHFVREYRRARLTRSSGLLALALARKGQELGLVRAADRTLVVSHTEKALLAAECPGADVHVVSNVHDVVDRPPPFDGRAGAVFVGHFQHAPNVDAARWLVEEVWPIVRSIAPGLTLTIVGPRPPAWLEGDGVQVTGEVPRVEPHLDAARLSVAPLRFGAGVKGKVLESMGRGVPVAGTAVAFEGMPAGEWGAPADDAEAIAAAVVAMHGDPAEWERRSIAGRAVVAEHFSRAAAIRALTRALATREVAHA